MSLIDHLLYEHPFGKAERIAEFYIFMTEKERDLYHQYLKSVYLGKRIDDVDLYLYRLNEFYQVNKATGEIERWN